MLALPLALPQLLVLPFLALFVLDTFNFNSVLSNAPLIQPSLFELVEASDSLRLAGAVMATTISSLRWRLVFSVNGTATLLEDFSNERCSGCFGFGF